jgi:hypothetical protein
MKLNLFAKGGKLDQNPFLPLKSGSPESLPIPAPVPISITLDYLINLAAVCNDNYIIINKLLVIVEI